MSSADQMNDSSFLKNRILYPGILLFLLFPRTIQAQTKGSQELKQKFTHISDTVQTSVYWYWISDHISRQGVINDLEAMKKVGINRAFIGNIFGGEPRGKVRLFSPEWWEITHTALKTATRLGIEIGIFNSPGWSQSGGPWVKPEQSMRYLNSSEIHLKGPMQAQVKLPKPESEFQDVRVIAYPVSKDYHQDISSLKPVVRLSPASADVKALTDQEESTVMQLQPKQEYTLDLSVQQPYMVRSLVIVPSKEPMELKGELQVRNSSGTYQKIKEFTVNRSNDALNVGFKPYGRGAISIPATSAKEFRIVFSSSSSKGGIAGIRLSGTPVVDQYIEKTEAKMWQDPFPLWNAYQWPSSPAKDGAADHIDPSKVIDISRFMAADGTLNWKVPAGNWIVERTGMSPTGVKNSPASPEGTGLETDKMSKKHIAAHFDAFLGEIIKRIPAEDRKTWKVTVEDSYETGGQNWTDGLIEKFKTVYGYDPLPWLPVMQGKVVGNEEQSDRFLWDLRRFVADHVAYEYVAGLREVSHQHGLTTWLENYGHWGFPGEFLQYGGQSDEVAGEFWSEGDLGNIENRAASSAAHIYGKTKVSAESFTASGPQFIQYPAVMKQRADRFFTEGINNSLLHVYVQQSEDTKLPGINAWFGNEFNRKNTWFNDMDIFLQYIKRCNMMLQQGKYVADVAYFISEDAPKMTGVRDPELPKGYSFDYINAEVIKTRLSVKDGRMVLPDGMNYKVLVLPKLETMRPELLLRIRELVKEGAIVLGPKPSRSPSLQNYQSADASVKAMAAELWGNIDGSAVKINRYGKGMVIDGMNLQEVMDMLRLKPDMHLQADSVLFIHRKLNDGSVYFLSNQTAKAIKISPEFRVTGKQPELWDATNGSTRDVAVFESDSVSTKVPLELAPLESAFVVFREPADAKKLESKVPSLVRSMQISTPWKVQFEQEMRGPAAPVTFNTLEDWSQNNLDSIKYYSGTAWYRNSFKMKMPAEGERVILSLGMVKAIAKVKVNGVEAGGVWTAPYQLDITGALRPGKNEIEVKVVNTWVNRLIGDSRLPLNERKTSIPVNTYTPESKLVPSGLLGPVSVEVIR